MRRRKRRRDKYRLSGIWRRSRVEPETGALEYAAGLGLLPGLGFRGSFTRHVCEEEGWPLAIAGTSPVTSVAAMAANIPMCIGCQFSDKANVAAVPKSNRDKVNRRGYYPRGKSRTRLEKCGSRRTSRSSSRSSSKCSSPQRNVRKHRQLEISLENMSCSAPYIPDSLESASSTGDMSRCNSYTESIPLMRRSKSAKNAVPAKCNEAVRQRWHRAALLLQVIVALLFAVLLALDSYGFCFVSCRIVLYSFRKAAIRRYWQNREAWDPRPILGQAKVHKRRVWPHWDRSPRPRDPPPTWTWTQRRRLRLTWLLKRLLTWTSTSFPVTQCQICTSILYPNQLGPPPWNYAAVTMKTQRSSIGGVNTQCCIPVFPPDAPLADPAQMRKVFRTLMNLRTRWIWKTADLLWILLT